MEADLTSLSAARNIDGHPLTGTFEQYAPALYKYAFRLCNNAVVSDQIMGDALAKLKEHLSTGNFPRANLRLLLYQMVYHLIVDNGRSSHRSELSKAEVFRNGDGDFIPISAENLLLLNAALQAIMNDLTEDQRHVLILRFMEGFSVKETAAIIGKTVTNVKVIQNRAMAALRKTLDYQVVETSAISIMLRSLSYA